MNGNSIRSGEILFVKCVKDGIPNRDPLRDSDARRIFGEEDGRISLSDVSIKRDIRDYVLARYPSGGENGSMFVFCREERIDGNKLLGREKLATTILERAERSKEKDLQDALLKSAFDMRVFGAVFSVKNKSFHQVGPVQFGWAHSLHPVETRYVQGTVVMPSKDTEVTDDREETEETDNREETKGTDSSEEGGKTQGTIWTMYTLPFAVFAMPGVINAQIAGDSKMSQEDVEVLLEGLWKGTVHRQARGRGIQQPLFLLHVEYRDPFDRIGFLEERVHLEPERKAWQEERPPSSLEEIKLNVEKLAETLNANESKIERIRCWQHTGIRTVGDLPGEAMNM